MAQAEQYAKKLHEIKYQLWFDFTENNQPFPEIIFRSKYGAKMSLEKSKTLHSSNQLAWHSIALHSLTG